MTLRDVSHTPLHMACFCAGGGVKLNYGWALLGFHARSTSELSWVDKAFTQDLCRPLCGVRVQELRCALDYRRCGGILTRPADVREIPATQLGMWCVPSLARPPTLSFYARRRIRLTDIICPRHFVSGKLLYPSTTHSQNTCTQLLDISLCASHVGAVRCRPLSSDSEV